jgi:vancomycin resistance protein VanJ
VRELAERYPHHALVPEVKRGAGVLSKYALRDAGPLRLSEGGNWNQRLVVETPLGQVTLFNVHPAVPDLRADGPGPLGLRIVYDSTRRSTEVARLVELVDGAGGPVLVTGDFNLSEYSRDYRSLQARLGDAYRTAGWGFGHTFPRAGSFPKSLPAPWPVVRLDYVWHSPELRPIAAHVGPSGGSDHHAVVVRLEPVDGRSP